MTSPNVEQSIFSERFYTTKEAAIYLNVSPRWIQLLINKGVIPVIGEGRKRLIPADSLEEYRRGTLGEITELEDEDTFLISFSHHVMEQSKAIDYERLQPGLKIEIEEAFAKLAQLLFKAKESQKSTGFHI